jgi:hypothetical protein
MIPRSTSKRVEAKIDNAQRRHTRNARVRIESWFLKQSLYLLILTSTCTFILTHVPGNGTLLRHSLPRHRPHKALTPYGRENQQYDV